MNKKLIQLRQELNLSQKEAANRIGISSSLLGMLEVGQRSGGDKTKFKVARFYGKTVDEIFFADHTHLE